LLETFNEEHVNRARVQKRARRLHGFCFKRIRLDQSTPQPRDFLKRGAERELGDAAFAIPFANKETR
jgi:hypothetical protein